MRKRYILLLAVCLLAGGVAVSAQTAAREHLSVSAGGRFSHILDGHDIYKNLLGTYNYGSANVSLSFYTRPEDGGWYEWAYNYPDCGISLSYARTGAMQFKNASRFGDIVNLYGWLEIPLVRTPHFRLGPLLEVGVAFTGHPYDYNRNPYNLYIGSKVFTLVGTGLLAEWLFAPRWALQAGVYATHHSNGMLRSPNLGYNELAVGVGVRHYLAPKSVAPKPASAPERPEYGKGLHWSVFAAAGVHSCPVELDAIHASNDPDRLAPARFRGVVGAELVWRYSPVFATGIGLEADYAVNDYRGADILLTGKEDPKGYSPLRAGIYLMQEFHYRQFSAHIVAGIYLFKRSGLTEDVGRAFEKVGARYQFRRAGGLFAGLDLCAHQFDRSYSLEWSLGYRF